MRRWRVKTMGFTPWEPAAVQKMGEMAAMAMNEKD